MTPVRVAVLASGGGSNLQALLDAFGDRAGGRRQAPVEIALVVSDRADAGALRRARDADVGTAVVEYAAVSEADVARALLEALEASGIELVVLAGFVRLVPAAVVARFRDSMLNIHPALLPAFGGKGMYGGRVHRAVVDAGCRVTGATVHFVDERYDSGPILVQWPVPVRPGDSAVDVAARVLAVEHRLLPAAVEAVARRLRGERIEAGGDGVAFEMVAADAPSPGSVRRALGLD